MHKTWGKFGTFRRVAWKYHLRTEDVVTLLQVCPLYGYETWPLAWREGWHRLKKGYRLQTLRLKTEEQEAGEFAEWEALWLGREFVEYLHYQLHKDFGPVGWYLYKYPQIVISQNKGIFILVSDKQSVYMNLMLYTLFFALLPLPVHTLMFILYCMGK